MSRTATSLHKPAGEIAAHGESFVIAEGRNPEVVAFENQVVAFFVSAAEILSVPKSVAAIYGVIVASPEPLSFSEIEMRLDFSKGSISQGLKLLREVGAVKESGLSSPMGETHLGVADEVGRPGESRPPPHRVPGGKVVTYAPDMELRELLNRFVRERVEKHLDEGKAHLASLEQAAGVFSVPEQKVLRSRISKMKQWNERTRAVLPIVRTFLRLTKI